MGDTWTAGDNFDGAGNAKTANIDLPRTKPSETYSNQPSQRSTFKYENKNRPLGSDPPDPDNRR